MTGRIVISERVHFIVVEVAVPTTIALWPKDKVKAIAEQARAIAGQPDFEEQVVVIPDHSRLEQLLRSLCLRDDPAATKTSSCMSCFSEVEASTSEAKAGEMFGQTLAENSEAMEKQCEQREESEQQFEDSEMSEAKLLQYEQIAIEASISEGVAVSKEQIGSVAVFADGNEYWVDDWVHRPWVN